MVLRGGLGVFLSTFLLILRWACVSGFSIGGGLQAHSAHSRRRSSLLSSSASSASSSSSLVSHGGESELVSLRNKYILDSIVSIARFSRFASRKLSPVKPLFKIADELKNKAKVILEAERQTNNEVKGLTSAERVLISTLSLLAIWQKALLREMRAIGSALEDFKWGVDSKLKWLLYLVGKNAKPAVSGTAGMFVLLADGWGPLYIIICALLNAALSKIIKKILRLPRPDASPKGGYGMPSSHAQTLFFFFTYLTLQLTGLVAQSQAGVDYFGVIADGSLPSIVSLGISSLGNTIRCLGTIAPDVLTPLLSNMHKAVPPLLTSTATTAGSTLTALLSSPVFISSAPIFLGLYACSASLWRVSTKLHSLGQTAVGASLGSSMGYLAYTRQPSNMAAFYESILVPFFGYAIATSRNTASLIPLSVPLKLKMSTLLIGFGLLYSKEMKKWSQNRKRQRREEQLVQTPAGMVKVMKQK